MTGDEHATGSTGRAGHEHAGRFDRSRAQDASEQAKRQARDAVDRARAQLRSMLGDGKQAAADRIEQVARALRASAGQLREENEDAAASYVDVAADSLADWGETLERNDVDSLAGQVQTFARRRPAAFLAGTAIAGFAATRFLKSSSALEGGRAASAPRAIGNDTRRPSTFDSAGADSRPDSPTN